MKEIKNNKVSSYNYVNALEDLLKIKLSPYQRVLMANLLDNKVAIKYPYFIRPRQSSMKFMYSFLKAYYGIDVSTELVEVNTEDNETKEYYTNES